MLTPATTPDPAAPRVLLFGHPSSGKTHLLAALVRAAEVQADALGAELIDPTGRLTALRNAVYAGAPFESTRTELHTVPVFLRKRGETAREFALADCDGRASSALLKKPDVLDAPRVTGTVAKAVLDADLLALVVSAGLTDDDLAERFEDFLFFLEQVHGRRLRERQVGGLPVFVVMTRCDVLAKPGDTTATWEAEVRWHLAKVRRQFEEFVDDQLPLEGHGPAYLPFGSVDVEGYATAVRRPVLADAPHPPAEPYGVAVLFRDAFAAAAAHRNRAKVSDRRLRHTVWSVGTAVALMVAGAAAVAVFQPAPADPELPARVRVYVRDERPAADRLAEKNITRNARVLTGFRSDPGFSALPPGLRDFVEGRLREVDAYQAYRKKLAETTAPADARTLDGLERVRAHLTTDLALPAEYTWGDTEAAKQRDRWLADVQAIRAAEAGWNDWYRGLGNQAAAMTRVPTFAGDWRGRVGALAEQGEHPPFAMNAVITGSEAVTYRTAFEFDRVYQARRDWEYARGRLFHLRDLADALGLTPPAPVVARPLVVPALVPDLATFPADRLADLRKYYPRGSELDPTRDGIGYPEWELANFPEPGRAALAAAVRESSGNGARVVRGLVRSQLGPLPTADTPEGWSRVADVLAVPPFRDWGRLLHVLARLENPAAADPVAELAAFLRTPEFPLDLRGAAVTIPLVLRDPPLVPTGPLTVTVTPRGGGAPVVRTYPPVGEPTRRDFAMTFTFGPAEKVTLRPGDGLRVELPVRSGQQQLSLVWDEGGTRTFPFDRLTREPRLVREGAVPEPATGVTLTPGPESVVPRVPGLLPETR